MVCFAIGNDGPTFVVAIPLSHHATHIPPTPCLLFNSRKLKYEFQWEDLYTPNPHLDAALAFAHKTRAEFIEISKHHRPISGKKRVAKYKEKQANRITASGEPQVEVMQSITATPVLKHASFEELRVECYDQSTVAKGSKPDPVDAVANPTDVIPPLFNAFKDVKEEEVADDVAMQD